MNDAAAKINTPKYAVLETVDRETMLRLAHIHADKEIKRDLPLYSFVMDACGVVSMVATEICKELGWNPDAPATNKLPGRTHE